MTRRVVGPNYPKRRIAILTAASLSSNPRAFKEAETLARAGFDVVVYGASFYAIQRETDQELADRHGFFFKSVLPVWEGGMERLLQSVWPRIRTRMGADLNRYLHAENHWQLGPAVVDLAKQARKAKADYYIAHLEQGAWVGTWLQRRGKMVGIDMEDWYSEDLPLKVRRSRPVKLLRDIERKLLTTGEHATCPSRAMSSALSAEFGCPQPTVVYNAFPWFYRESIDGLFKDRMDRHLPSIHWFSQTLGYDRGLEDLITAIPLLKHEVEIHLRGRPVKGFENWLFNRVPNAWVDRVKIHSLVSNEELLSRIAEHDIGFAGETPKISNKNLTVSNKVLYYLLAGLAVVASSTAGQREIAEQAPAAVFIYPSGNVLALASRIDVLLSSTENLRKAKAAALDAAERTFCWERQEKTLLEAINRALSPPARQHLRTNTRVE
jgi:glycosyltransferase involved in cell wall biosynthesis